MQISLLKDSCFKVKAKKLHLVIGPLKDDISKIKADIVIIPHQKDDIYFKKIGGRPFVINAPGEYEISGVSIFGIDGVYVIEIDGIRFCYLSKLDSGLTDEQLEEVDGVDILLILVGEYGFSINQAVKITNQIQPKITVPVGEGVVDQFLKEIGYEEGERVKRLTIAKNSLPEEMKVVVLERKNG